MRFRRFVSPFLCVLLSSCASIIGVDGNRADAPPDASSPDSGVARPSVRWGHTAGTLSDEDFVEDVAIDAHGNAYFVGEMGGTSDHVTYDFSFGCGTHSVTAGRDAFLVKYAPDGTCLWSKTFPTLPGGAHDEFTTRTYARGVTLTPAGDVIIVGQFDGIATFGGNKALNPGPTWDMYLAKFSPSGEHVWSRNYGGTGPEWAYDVAHDSADGIYVAGHYYGDTDLGLGALPIFGDNDMFLAKFRDAEDGTGGDTVWARAYGTPSSDVLTHVLVDSAGQVVTTGVIDAPINIDGIHVDVAGSYDYLVTRHAADTGQALWAISYGGPGDDQPNALDLIDSTALVAGYFQGNADFKGMKLSSDNASRDAVLIGLDITTGATQFGERWGGPGDDNAYAVVGGVEGRIAIAGHFESVLSGVNTQLQSAGGWDAFVITTNSANPSLWSGHRYGGAGNDEVRALAWTDAATLAFGGMFEQTFDMVRPPASSVGGHDVFFGYLNAYVAGD